MTWRRALVVLCLASFAMPAGAAESHVPIPIWRLRVHGWGEPASDGSSTFVLAQGHELLAVDTATGTIAWRSPTGGPGEVTWGSAVRIAGERVIVGDDAVVAFDRATGAESWRFVPPGGPGSGPYLGDARAGLLMLGSPNGRVYAVDATSGRLRWTRTVATVGPTTVFAPIWVGDRIVASFTTFGAHLSGGVVAFDATGRRLWRQPLTTAGAGGPPIDAGGSAVVAQTDGHVLAFHAGSGRRLWLLPRQQSRDPRQPLLRDVRALSASGSILVTGSLTGAVIAYDIATRHERWRYDDGPDNAAPLRIRTDDRTAYVPFTNGVLMALDLDSGRERWRAGGADGVLPWPPSLTGDAVIAAGDDAIVAFARGEGPDRVAGADTR